MDFASTIKPKDHHVRTLGKEGSPFYIDSKIDVINFNYGELRISVDLSSYVEFDSVSYKWIIPKGARLNSGTIDGILTKLSPNNPIRLDLDIADLNMNINQNIILLIDRKVGENTLGMSFVIASRKDLTEEFQKISDNETSDEGEFKPASVNKKSTSTIKKKFIY
jgi:hypothetical protein